jgi:hypothetical protein
MSVAAVERASIRATTLTIVPREKKRGQFRK